MYFLQPRACYAALQDTKVLLCIDIERFLVDGGIVVDLIDCTRSVEL
jgi:hypothetical protein